MANATKVLYTIDDFLIVLVLYRIDLEHSPSFISLDKCTNKLHPFDLMVYDNSPGASSEINNFERNGFRIHYINDPSNPGVSTAYNTGISFAMEKKKNWILFLDQDTTLDETLLDKLLVEINTNQDVSIFATTLFGSDDKLISPSGYFFKRGFSLSKPPIGKCELQRTRPINSSVLIATEVFKKVGVYNPRIRLDFSDHEFFDRVTEHYKYMRVVASNSAHSLSSSDDTHLDEIKIRFGIFCEGAHVAAKKSWISGVQYFIVCAMRAIKLDIQFKTAFFIKTLFKEWTKR